MKKEEREKIRFDFKSMIVDSWTFRRMFNKERRDCMEALDEAEIYGNTRDHVWRELHSVYIAFLYGIGYPTRKDPCKPDWREDVETDKVIASLYFN